MFSTTTGTCSAIEVNRKIVINGVNANEMLILAFVFIYDSSPHTICPFGQLATVFINAGENPTILLGYLEDNIVDMVLSQANTNRQIQEVLGITRDEQTNNSRTQHIINLYTSSRRFGTPTPGFDQIEVYRACNPRGTAWHQE